MRWLGYGSYALGFALAVTLLWWLIIAARLLWGMLYTMFLLVSTGMTTFVF